MSDERELHPLIRWALDRQREKTERQRQRKMRRQLALRDNPLGNAELAAAEAEQDAYFGLVDERDQAIADLDALAVEKEHRADDEPAG
jgi:hypothetical protein